MPTIVCKKNSAVLILVLMEDTLRVTLYYLYDIGKKNVLILVLMEDTLRVGMVKEAVSFCMKVLILVLMEDTLRARRERSLFTREVV